MGMYTGFRFSGTAREDVRGCVDVLFGSRCAPGPTWFEFTHIVGHFDISNDLALAIVKWASVGRADCIPWGWSADMRGGWTKENSFDPKTGRWRFSCSLKNYEGEIEQFISDVLPLMIESCNYCEVLYDWWGRGELYDFDGEKMIRAGETEVYYERE